jgi:hypothetical protein
MNFFSYEDPRNTKQDLDDPESADEGVTPLIKCTTHIQEQ